MALSSLLNEKLFAEFKEAAAASTSAVAPKPPHYAPRPKASSTCLCQAGLPSSNCWITSRSLRSSADRKYPKSLPRRALRVYQRGCQDLGPLQEFKQYGQCGTRLSDLLPHLSKVVDDIAVIRSMHTDQFNHAPAQIFMNTGSQLMGRPSMGSWLTYGLGSENSDLPGFVVLLSGENNPDGGKSCWSSGFLPTTYQGVEFRSKGDRSYSCPTLTESVLRPEGSRWMP
jgi:hypothetical protein